MTNTQTEARELLRSRASDIEDAQDVAWYVEEYASAYALPEHHQDTLYAEALKQWEASR